MRHLLILLAATLALAACGSTTQTAAPAPDAAAAPASADVVQTVDGMTVALGTGRPTALFFMAAWCVDCLGEADAWRQLVEAEQTQGMDVLVIDVDPSDTRDTLAQFRAALPSDPLHWVMDQDGQLARRFTVQRLDTTVILDGSGREVYRDLGPSSPAQLRDALTSVEVQP